jgi:hypothetical protein
MHLSKIECPHCGRPFVDFIRLENHIQTCAAERQRELDRKWREAEAGKEAKPRNALSSY